MEKRISYAGRRIKTQEMVLCGVFTTLIAVGAFIKIPIPALPFTMQMFFTMLAGLLLGGRLGALSVGVYILLGLVGLPVFTEGGGFWYIINPRFGYLLGYLLGTYVTGSLAERKNKLLTRQVIALNFLNLFIIFAVGLVYHYVICNYVIETPVTVGFLFWYCFIMLLPGDIVQCILAAILTVKVKPIMEKMRS